MSLRTLAMVGAALAVLGPAMLAAQSVGSYNAVTEQRLLNRRQQLFQRIERARAKLLRVTARDRLVVGVQLFAQRRAPQVAFQVGALFAEMLLAQVDDLVPV